ncbi:hypothetical protein BH10PLA2_BH10PLA2_09850 [soil metagenome]
MRLCVLFLASLPLFAGCQTHLALRDDTVSTTATLTDLNYQQVLNNVAMFVAQPSSMPSFAVVNSGTVTVADQKTFNGSAAYAPTLSYLQQSGGQPILNLIANPSSQRNVTENWSLLPVTDVDNLRRIRCAFQLLVLNGGETTNCYQCLNLLKQFYLGETDRMDCVLPKGWYHTSCCKEDVPKNACYKANYGNTYVWVTSEGIEGLSLFTMTVIDLATGKPHAPTKTVVRNFKADGTLDSSQVTTTEVDREALERMKTADHGLDRPRQYVNPPVVNPGLFFVPH